MTALNRGDVLWFIKKEMANCSVNVEDEDGENKDIENGDEAEDLEYDENNEVGAQKVEL